MSGRGMVDVLSQLGERWADFISLQGEGSKNYERHFGFFYDDKVELSWTFPRLIASSRDPRKCDSDSASGSPDPFGA